ncbi:hypothetical protein [Aquimarina aggregata]|uniref:hypothetical protein n=1 Tax=Aquimarina aggregata TaxID=1642818 RepID=UPI002493838B|nr:hypothetical protein [Aquimarina aggregata]
MKIDENMIKEYIQKALVAHCIQIRDHRNNILVLNKGVFSFNNHQQPKTIASIETIFLDAFKLTRSIKLDNLEYIRKGSRWYIKNE